MSRTLDAQRSLEPCDPAGGNDSLLEVLNQRRQKVDGSDETNGANLRCLEDRTTARVWLLARRRKEHAAGHRIPFFGDAESDRGEVKVLPQLTTLIDPGEKGFQGFGHRCRQYTQSSWAASGPCSRDRG